jgi:hypothetical protein
MPTTLLAIVSFGIALVMAAGDGEPRCPRPPREAVEACVDHAAGDACSFEGRDGTVTGTCWKPSDAPADAPLACAPAQAQSR